MPNRTGIPSWPFSLNRDSQQALGLVAWWPLLASGGARRVTDMSRYAAHAAWGSGNSNVVDGEFGRGVTFDETTNAIISIGQPAQLKITGALTLSAWLRLNASATTTNQGIVGRWIGVEGGSGVSKRSYLLAMTHGSSIPSAYFAVSSDGG